MGTAIIVVICLLAIAAVAYIVLDCAELLKKRFNLSTPEYVVTVLLLAHFPWATFFVYLFVTDEREKTKPSQANDPQ